MSRKRFAHVGLGERSFLYQAAILGAYQKNAELVGLCDSNQGRLAQRIAWAKTYGVDIPGYSANEFERMLEECRADCVIVTSMDSTHDDYICRSMIMGCDVITEKPMTITAEKCQRIIDTIHKTKKQLRVTFNYRYAPVRTQVKHLLSTGIIGEVLSVDFHWLLDTRHGADYFRRWHRNKQNSGGLLVHKATHHFDLVNWWLSSIPEKVYATGERRFYTPQTALRYGLEGHAERCLDCQVSSQCNFYLDINAYPHLKYLYLDNEIYDGYYRDRCVFSEKIDIEDTVALTVTYQNGVSMSYSLNAFMPWEGYIISFNGTKGRMEHRCEETIYISGDGRTPGELKSEGTTIRINPHFAPAYHVDLWEASGGHGGGDELLAEDIFGEKRAADPYLRAADHRSGAYSILVGIAANTSIEHGAMVRIADLISGLEKPDYPKVEDLLPGE